MVSEVATPTHWSRPERGFPECPDQHLPVVPKPELCASFAVKSSYQPQDYVISAANRGFYISPAQQPGDALSLLHGSGENRAEIAIWHNEQQDNQKWYLDHA
ncbi:hypothetical protein OPQ81_005321 [Rhizoctonia solani]|nr:hypothetical protein OPQ81_005321 [Rhizoctonia solani]